MKCSIPKELDFYEAWQQNLIDPSTKKLRTYKWLDDNEQITYNVIAEQASLETGVAAEPRIKAAMNLFYTHHPLLREKHNLVLYK
jgi:hypothetical protein